MRKSDNMKVLICVVIFIALVWTTDAVLDTLYSSGASFRDLMAFRVPMHDIISRLLVAAGFIAVYVSYSQLRAKRHRIDSELQKHLMAIETSVDGIAIFDEGHQYLYVNDAYARINGYRPADMVGRTFSLIYDDPQRAWLEQNVFSSLEETGKWRGELTAHRKDGGTYLQESSVTQLPDGGCVCVMRDITERRRKEDELRRSEAFLNTIFNSIHDPFCIIDAEFKIIRANDAYARLKNRAMNDLIDRTCYRVIEGKNDVCEGCVVRKTFQSSDPCAKEKRVALRTGESLWLEIYTYPVTDEAGRVTQVIEYTRDVTDRKRADEERRRLIDRLEYLSQVDGLTGLLNRRALTDQLAYEIERARRYETDLSVILCDLDNLKEINDTHGHLAGDLALQVLSATLRSSLRSADIAGRYGGDEFLVIVPQTPRSGAESIAEKIRSSAERTEVSLEGGVRLSISLSIGVASLGPPPEDMDEFVSRVDAALYTSKQEGRNRISSAD